MRLSTAIRIGSMTTKQIRVFFTDGGNGRCALGAACDAAGLSMVDDATGYPNYSGLVARFPILNHRFPSPVTGELVLLTMMIYTLNDSYQWSRDRIADYVEKMEEADGYLQTGVTESKPLELIAQEDK